MERLHGRIKVSFVIKLLFIIIMGLTIAVLSGRLSLNLVTYSHVRQVKLLLKTMAEDKNDTRRRLATIKAKTDKSWADDHIGICADGYIFYFDIHNIHMDGLVGDCNVLYLPDERRYIINYLHYCCGEYQINKQIQAKDKKDLLTRF